MTTIHEQIIEMSKTPMNFKFMIDNGNIYTKICNIIEQDITNKRKTKGLSPLSDDVISDYILYIGNHIKIVILEMILYCSETHNDINEVLCMENLQPELICEFLEKQNLLPDEEMMEGLQVEQDIYDNLNEEEEYEKYC